MSTLKPPTPEQLANSYGFLGDPAIDQARRLMQMPGVVGTDAALAQLQIGHISPWRQVADRRALDFAYRDWLNATQSAQTQGAPILPTPAQPSIRRALLPLLSKGLS